MQTGRCFSAVAAVVTGLLLAAGLTGCEPMVLHEGSQTNSDVSGVWSYVDTSGARSIWTLTQAADASVLGSGTAGEGISGYVNADSVNMTIDYSTNFTTSVNGTVSGDTMAGTFTNSASVHGAWTALKTN